MKPILFTKQAKAMYSKLESMFKKQTDTFKGMSFATVKNNAKKITKK